MSDSVLQPTQPSTPLTTMASSSTKRIVHEALPTEYVSCCEGIEGHCVNAIRCVAPVLPLTANSGHPGAPMGCALIAHSLFGREMIVSPKNPHWWNRDRFVLSNGHGCALQYLMLHLIGYPVSLDDLKNFRQFNSITPGHPEVHMTPGVEVTTGPLGQGIAQAVGLAIAQANLAATFNKPDFPLFTNRTFVILGDGCMQEGVASEACSLAGHLGLSNLIAFYDDNQITIDGNTAVSFTEDVGQRFESYGWHVQWVNDGNRDIEGLRSAIKTALSIKDRPCLIGVRTIIAYGSKIQGTAKSHGSPLSAEDILALRQKCGFSSELWDIPSDVLNYYRAAGQKGDEKAVEWESMFQKYMSMYSQEGNELVRRFNHQLPENWMSNLPTFTPESKAEATRSLSQTILRSVHNMMPELMGGSADLTESNKTDIPNEKDFQACNPSGRYLRFGVREHAMVAICNGLHAYGGHRAFAATFLNFYTYAWGAVRLSALSNLGVCMIASHDSIDLGEDGPTHQPIETAALMRATPNLLFVRPCDGNETSGAYAIWMTNAKRPTVIALSRSNLPHLENTSIEKTMKGGYILEDFQGGDGKKICLAGSGTETQHAKAAAAILRGKGYNVRVVSMPCWELFDEQGEEYKRSVIPHKRDAVCAYIEAFSTYGFARYFEEEASVGMETFGQSAPAKVLMKHFGFSGEAFASKVEKFINEHA